MPAKKAAKKSAKKAAKKSHGKHHEHHAAKDLRRAYEHLGRLEALESSLPPDVLAQIATLTEFSRQTLQNGDARNSAELLRACEHIAFSALATNSRDSVNDELRDAIGKHYEKLREEAIDLWDEHGEKAAANIRDAFEWAFSTADTAYEKNKYRRALEMIRAAVALAHVHGDSLSLPPAADTKPKRLKK
jgi:hypothetical protein